MLPEFAAYRAVWVEITGAELDHGGPGWGFGTCLWSPATDEKGGKRYEAMWQPEVGDLVLHFYKYPWEGGAAYTQLCGFSTVAAPCRVMYAPPPRPGRWQAAAYYRIDLQSYTPLSARLNPQRLNQQPDYLARIRAELHARPIRYPFVTYGQELVRLTQGQYITRCTPVLYDVFRDALGYAGGASLAVKPPALKAAEYQEGRRKLRETYFFARNPQLAAEAKRLRRYTCEVCAFNFHEHYGEHGKEYAECHHKNPLSERPEETWTHEVTTSLADVAVVCANCHRMLHRQRPALSIEALIVLRNVAQAIL
jgi:hypothetical protein